VKFSRISLISTVSLLLLLACAQEGTLPTVPSTSTVSVGGTVSIPTTTALPAIEFSPIPLKAGLGFRASWLELYFTDPTSSFAAQNFGGADGPISAAIVAARESVDVALNSLGVNSITEALIRVHQRGIPVRMVIETDNLVGRPNLQALTDAGIPIIEDRRDDVMNNTFIIIDHNQIWTGSIAYTSSGIFRENNNLIRIFSKEIADDYTKEFDEMFVHDQFGINVVPETPHPSVIIQETQVEVFFSPDDVVVTRLIQLLEEAQESIYFLSYSFNSSTLGTVIRNRAAQGVNVAGVMESSQVVADGAIEFDIFRQAGLDVRLSNANGVMNHKVIIIDNKIVVMGSYDYTDRAENRNDENVLIIHQETVAQKFTEEFQRIQSRAQP